MELLTLMSIPSEPIARVREYAKRHALALVDEFGHGVHGSVFAAESQPEKSAGLLQWAVKVHKNEADYRRERDIYLRLEENDVTQIRGCDVPQLMRFDDEFLIIEMTAVRRPFLLDFAGAFLDKAPDFSDEVMADWLAKKREQFGARWPEVAAILRVLEGFGIHYMDVSPKNISLPE